MLTQPRLDGADYSPTGFGYSSTGFRRRAIKHLAITSVFVHLSDQVLYVVLPVQELAMGLTRTEVVANIGPVRLREK